MRQKRFFAVNILLAVVVLLAGSVTATASAAGTGPDDALTPPGEWDIWVMRADGSGQQPLFGSELDGLRSTASFAVTLDYAALGERAISWTR